MRTHLALSYAAALQVIHRAHVETAECRTALDLGCGPGHFTLCLSKYLHIQHVEGLDLAEPMVAAAIRNASKQSAAVTFRIGNATDLKKSGIKDNFYDLVCFNQSAHHMPDLTRVQNVIREMERVAKPGGLLLITDLVRLKTASLTDRYVNIISKDYEQMGLPEFSKDFHNSMYAAWTPTELCRAIPVSTERHWYHVTPWGLPTIQILLGLPVDRSQPYWRSGAPWASGDSPVPKDLRQEWRLLQFSLAIGKKRVIQPILRH